MSQQEWDKAASEFLVRLKEAVRRQVAAPGELPPGRGGFSSLEPRVQHMDMSIAVQLISIGGELKKLYRSPGHFELSSQNGGRIFEVARDEHGDGPNKCTMRRAEAAAVIRFLSEFNFPNDDEPQTFLNPPVDPKREWFTYKGVAVRNSLADTISFPKGTPMYYIYNMGVEHLVCRYPRATFAMLVWRVRHKNILSYSKQFGKSKITEDDYHNVTQSLLQMAKERSIGVEALIDEIFAQSKPFLEHMSKIKPIRKFSR